MLTSISVTARHPSVVAIAMAGKLSNVLSTNGGLPTNPFDVLKALPKGSPETIQTVQLALCADGPLFEFANVHFLRVRGTENDLTSVLGENRKTPIPSP
jgi:hypothetical protein